MTTLMDRRAALRLICGAAAGLPGAALAQGRALPKIGYLGAGTPAAFATRLSAFRAGLAEYGLVDGQTVAIEFRWAEGRPERLEPLAAELRDEKVVVIVAPGGAPAPLAARKATDTIPIVFEMGASADKVGLVQHLNRPEGNVTGVSSLNVDVSPKRLDLLRELIPGISTVGVVINPMSPTAAAQERELREAGQVLGLQLHVLMAARVAEIGEALAAARGLGAGGVVVASDGFFATNSEAFAEAAQQERMPAIHQSRDFVLAGGLMSYGGNFMESHRQCGTYAARVVKGEKVADLPVQTVRQVEMFINLASAQSLGVPVPRSFASRADHVVD